MADNLSDGAVEWISRFCLLVIILSAYFLMIKAGVDLWYRPS